MGKPKTCWNCGKREATERNGVCEPCICTVDCGPQLPAGAELEPGVRRAGGAVFAQHATDYVRRDER